MCYTVYREIAESLRKNFNKIKDTTESSLSRIASELYSKGLITESALNELKYNSIISEVKAKLRLEKDYSGLKRTYEMFLDCLSIVSGPPKCVSEKLQDEWEDIQKCMLLYTQNCIYHFIPGIMPQSSKTPKVDNTGLNEEHEELVCQVKQKQKIKQKTEQKMKKNSVNELVYFQCTFDAVIEGHVIMAEKMKKIISDAKGKMKELCQSDEIMKLDEVKKARCTLNFLDSELSRYIKEVNELISKLKKDNEKIIDDLKKHKFEQFDGLTELLQKGLATCEEIHKSIETHSHSFRKECTAAADKCQELSDEKESKKLAAQVVGGTLTAAAIAGGITASVLVGVFTFGIGLAVGLPATIAGGTAIVTTTLGTTIALTIKYKNAAESFHEMSSSFDSSSSEVYKAIGSSDGVSNVNGELKRQVSMLITILERASKLYVIEDNEDNK